MASELSESFAISQDLALLFLIQSHWDSDKVTELYFEDPDVFDST